MKKNGGETSTDAKKAGGAWTDGLFWLHLRGFSPVWTTLQYTVKGAVLKSADMSDLGTFYM